MHETIYDHAAELQNNHWWFVGRRKIFSELLKTLNLPSKAKILDIGALAGGNLSMLAEFGSVEGLEPVQSAIDSYSGPHKIYQGSIPQDHELKEGQYDLITLLDVIEHIEDDVGSLEAAYKLLKPGGQIFISVPAFPLLWTQRDDELDHKRRYTKKSLRQLFSTQSNLEIKKLSYFNFILFFPIVLGGLLEKFGLGFDNISKRVPNPFINSILASLFSLEKTWLKIGGFFFGVSLVAVLKKPETIKKYQAEKNIAAIQQTIYNSKNPVRYYLHNSRKNWVLSHLQKLSDKQSRVLEIGIGSGQYSEMLAEQNHELFCLDIEEEHFKSNREFLANTDNAYPMLSDIRNSPFYKNQFDLILMSEVLEHIPNTQLVISELNRLLKPGGKLVLTTPQKYSLIELLGKVAYLPGIVNFIRFIYREPIEPKGHISLHTDKEMREYLRNDFKILEQKKLALYIPLLSEFGGEFAANVCKKLETLLENTPLDALLWTQCYILEKQQKDKS